MTQQAPQTPARRELAAALRGLRVDAGLSTTKFADQLGWTQSRVSRLERGVTHATRDDVDAWTQVTHADPDTKRHLMKLADESRSLFTEWRHELGRESALRRLQEEIRGLEEGASVIRMFGADVVPGLAQTPKYALRMVLLGQPDAAETEDLDAVMDARKARQEVLDSGKHIRLLMSETAVRRHLVPAPDQVDQIERLVELIPQRNVHLGVIPFDAVEREHQYQGYAILGDPEVDENAIVLAETLTRGLRLRQRDEIAAYVEHYERLDSTALHGDELRAFLLEVAENTTWP